VPRSRAKDSTITIRDIARQAGFSASTVSIVLNDAPLARYIRASTKKRIEDVAHKLGYSPNQLARSLRNQRNHTVGVIVFDITDPFCTPILRGIETSLYQASYVPILTDAHNERPRFERYLEMLLERRIEGLIVIANWLFVDIDVLADLEKQKIPTAVIGRQLTDSISSVMVDNEAGARMAVEHLYELGHREIAFIRGPKELADSGQRWRGVRSFARAAGLKIDPKLTVDLPDVLDPNHAFETAQRVTEELLRQRRSFTAVMAFDDITALGAIRALTKAGVKVPEQCSVIGFDDVAPAALSAPPLTTIRQPMTTMGATAVQIVVDAISAASDKLEVGAMHRRLAPELVVRESTRRRS
jgi:DNA-binding LacI/PurR family transcriptional regulator